MTTRTKVSGAAFVAGLLVVLQPGCGSTFVNLTKERTGNVTVVFVNNTPYRAGFSYGSYDAWDRSYGTVTLQQLSMEAHTTSTAATIPCRRNVAVGTDDFVARVQVTQAYDTDTFNADLFGSTVSFSSAPTDSTAVNLPTEGTALGREVLLGIDYSCADELIFTFVEDPASPGGFRIDYQVIIDAPLVETGS